MGFKSYQERSKLENILKFSKSQEDMVKYYNWKYTFALVSHPSDQVFLDFLNIHMACSSAELSHYCLRPYMVEKQVESILYYLKLSPIL